MKYRNLLLITIALLSHYSFACDLHENSEFAPENNIKIEVNSLITNGMTKVKFNSIIARVEKVYTPIVKQKGGRLHIVRGWNDSTVNAYAKRTSFYWQINMFGGLARHPLVTDDGFMLVVCHELGHHIGGAPKSSEWAANEGQADYFGTMKCMRRILENDNNRNIISTIKVDEEAQTKCQNIYHNDNEIALCERIAMAGKSLALVLADLGGSSKVEFNTPDKSIVTRTDNNHPAAQCRLDTYFNGILCDKSWDQDVDNSNPITGVCTKRDGYSNGVRPLCWYKPRAEEI
jgi:hypothetical protein